MTKTILDYAHGIHRDVPADIYHGRHLGLVSKSALDLVHHSLSKYKAWIDGALDEERSEAFDLGTAFHMALLEPEWFASTYAVAPDFGDLRFKENKAKREKWRSENEGKKALDADHDRHIRGMIASVRAHRLASKILSDGIPEVTVRWRDEETGLECKTRTDYLVKRLEMAADLKTAEDATFEGFRRAVARYRYHVTDALYRKGFGAIGAPVRHYVFVVVEKKPPYDVATYALDEAAIAMGHDHALRDMKALAEAVRIDEWPGLPFGIQTIDLPRWAA